MDTQQRRCSAAVPGEERHQQSRTAMSDLQPPKEVSNGTVTYIMLTIFAIICVWVSRFMGKLTKDEAQ